jgi:iron complex outermembrane receptor protein
VFGELTLKPTQRTELLAGLRYDNFKNSDGAIITDGAPQTFADREFDFWSPRLAGRYQVDDAVAVRAAYYQGFRAPTLSNLYRSFETPTFRGLSNPNLKEERLKGGDVGLDFRAGALTSQVNYFYNILKDFVGSAEVGFVTGKFTVQNENVAQIRSRGLEFVGDLRFTKEMGVTVNFAYTDSVVTRGPYEGNKTEGTPEQAISVSLYQRSPSGLSWNLRWRYVGDTFQDITNTSEGFQDAHSLLDALVTYRVKKNLDLFVSGTNLLDEEYISDGFGQTLGAPRQISAGARLRF